MNSMKMHNNNVQVVQEVPNATEAGVLNPNTGFPEPLHPDRNTTLPHPDADKSKNASIEAADVALSRAHSRTRFLHHRQHSQNKSIHGKIEQGEKAVRGKKIGGPTTDGLSPASKTSDAPVGIGERSSPEKAEKDEEQELKTEKEGDEKGSIEREQKTGVLRKLHLHKV